MPRGKNYVNNNRGMSMQSSIKKKAPSMEQCFYGSGCTRANCIYRHDAPPKNGDNNNANKSTEPCMPFLAGSCTFSAQGCRKRHPGKKEADILIAKYRQTKCRYGNQCKTNGCLYIHPGDNANGNANNTNDGIDHSTAFPPLAGTAGGPPFRTSLPSAWKPAQPTGATLAVTASTTSTTNATTASSDRNSNAAPRAWTPPAQQPPSNNVWGQPIPNSVTSPTAITPAAATVAVATPSTQPPTTPRSFAAAAAAGAAKDLAQPVNGNGNTTNIIKSNNKTPTPQPETPSPETPPPQTATEPQPRSSETLNIHAKEFIPGVGFSSK